MRSLPSPRITRTRRWKRIKRAFKTFLEKGYLSDGELFFRRHKSNTNKNASSDKVSTLRSSRLFSRRVKRANSIPGEWVPGVKPLGLVGRTVGKFGWKNLKRGSSLYSLNIFI